MQCVHSCVLGVVDCYEGFGKRHASVCGVCWGTGRGVFVVDSPDGRGEPGIAVVAGVIRHTDANDFQRVCEEHTRYSCQRSGQQSSYRCLLFRAMYNHGANLLVGEKFNSGVGENSEDCSGMSTVETHGAFVTVDGAHDVVDAGPGAGVAREVGVGGLEEDFDAVERGDY